MSATPPQEAIAIESNIPPAIVGNFLMMYTTTDDRVGIRQLINFKRIVWAALPPKQIPVHKPAVVILSNAIADPCITIETRIG